ncbi:MAG: cell division protein FtsK [Neisseria mucosa]|nr:cell division protein FtsK [Neisseria mucosa]
MLWTILALILLAVITGLFWWRQKQEQKWRQELAQLSGDEQEINEENSSVGFSDQLNSLKRLFSMNKRTADNHKIARIRLLSALEHNKMQRAETEEEHTTEPVAEEPEHIAATEEEIKVAPKTRKSAKPERIPKITPFAQMETPEYSPSLVQNSNFEEITLEEATRSLHEAAVEEWNEHLAEKNAPIYKDEVETPLLRASSLPMTGMEIIDYNDPILRRTRERALSRANNVRVAEANAPHIETVQTALRTAEKEAILPYTSMQAFPSEIQAEDIHDNLARRTAARHKLAAAVAPLRDYSPRTIENDEILANLGQISRPASLRRQVRHTEAAAERWARKRAATEAVAPQPATPSRPKPAAPVKKSPYISRPAAPNATVVEPPAVPVVPMAKTDIPEPPVFQTSIAPIDIPEPPAFEHKIQVPIFDSQVNAHVSNQPERSIRDYLISESAEEETEFDGEPATPAQAETEAIQAVETIEPVEPVETIVRPSEYTQTVVETPVQSVEPSVQEDTPSVVHPTSTTLTDALLPTTALLLPPQFDPSASQTEEQLLENSITIEEKLAEFKVKVKVMDSYSGPVITRYEIEPDVGVRGSAVLNLEKDLARSLGVASIRVVETIPGKTCMGLELPNPKRQMIRLSEIFNSPAFTESKSKLTLALGQDITGQPVVTDLAKAPHLLVAGTTGSGKSVGVNAMILSMLFKATPEDVRMIMIDPKMLELSIYEGIPHLLAPVVTDMKLAANALNWCVNEMEKRYRLMSFMGVRNLAGFNQKIAEAAARGEKIGSPFSLTPEDPEPLEKLPFIVVIVDEFADLMMTVGKKIEELIARLAQKARAAGIHLILATQRPSVDVITGLIKANIPTRIAFQVSSKIDSRTILDQMGAENLLGQGDMLFLPPGTGYPQRVHGAFASDNEVHRVVEYLKQFGAPDYIDDILSNGSTEDFTGTSRSNDSDLDPMYDEAVSVVLKSRKASISNIQRQLRIGYNRAARLIDQMEADGIVSPAENNGNRTILAQSSDHLD